MQNQITEGSKVPTSITSGTIMNRHSIRYNFFPRIKGPQHQNILFFFSFSFLFFGYVTQTQKALVRQFFKEQKHIYCLYWHSYWANFRTWKNIKTIPVRKFELAQHTDSFKHSHGSLRKLCLQLLSPSADTQED